MFVQPFSFVSYYFLELNLMILISFYFQEIYNNRLRERYEDDPSTHLDFDPDLWMEADRLVDPIEIGCIDSLALQLKTCRQPIVSQPLGARNRYRAPSLRSSQSCYSKECKNIWPI